MVCKIARVLTIGDAAAAIDTQRVALKRQRRREILIGIAFAIAAVLIMFVLVGAFASFGADPMAGT